MGKEIADKNLHGKEEGGLWKRTSKEELRNMFNKTPISQLIQRLRWLKHVSGLKVKIREGSDKRKK